MKSDSEQLHHEKQNHHHQKQLYPITFIIRLMHSIIQNLEIKI